MSSLFHHLVLFLSAFVAGAVNSVAGGGTLLTFPALLWAGVPPVTANATSTVALVPGSASAFWNGRTALGSDMRLLIAMAVPSAIGGAVGANVVLHVGDALFAALVPWLLLGATVLFTFQSSIERWMQGRANISPQTEQTHGVHLLSISVFQFLVALYGGFFGAGIGIVMLAALGLAGLRDIYRMNALKNFAAVCINGVATVTFVLNGRVRWPLAVPMAIAAIAGGYSGTSVAKKIGPVRVRYVVSTIGFVIAGYMFLQRCCA